MVYADFALENWRLKGNCPGSPSRLGSFNHMISDLVIRIKNAALARRRKVILSYSKLNLEVGRVLVKNGFLEDIKEDAKTGKKNLLATIKYEKRVPVMMGTTIISKPSLRSFEKSKHIFNLERKGKRILIVSTSQGVMTGREAREKGIGGEVLFAIW